MSAYFGSGDLYSQARENQSKKRDGGGTAAAVSLGSYATSRNNTSDASEYVAMPNTQHYYSTADTYGSINPADPSYGMWNVGLTKTDAVGALGYDSIVSPAQRAWMKQVAEAIHPLKGAKSLWEEAVAAAQLSAQMGEYKTPFAILQDLYGSGAQAGAGDGSSSSSYGGYGGYGGGGYSSGGGGTTTVNLMNEEDARAVVNTLSTQMLGRTVSEKEFQGYYKGLLQMQRKNPQEVSYGDDGTVEVTAPVGADGLRYGLEEDMRNTKAFVTNQVGTQALGLLQQYIESRRVSG